jgi:hypothetical protein
MKSFSLETWDLGFWFLSSCSCEKCINSFDLFLNFKSFHLFHERDHFLFYTTQIQCGLCAYILGDYSSRFLLSFTVLRTVKEPQHVKSVERKPKQPSCSSMDWIWMSHISHLHFLCLLTLGSSRMHLKSNHTSSLSLLLPFLWILHLIAKIKVLVFAVQDAPVLGLGFLNWDLNFKWICRHTSKVIFASSVLRS